MKRLLVSLSFLLLAGCDKPSSSPSATPSAAPVASAPAAPSATASAAATASASAAPSGAAAALGAASSWKGTYKAKVGAVNPPKDAKIQLWAKDPGTELVGDGTVHLTVTGTTVKGEAKGALGDQVLAGTLDEKDLSARVDPKDPNTEAAMTGVLTGKVEGASIQAVIRVSGRNGNIVREATVTLTRE